MSIAQTLSFVHGWAYGSSVWQPLLEDLPDDAKAECWRLPGYAGIGDEPALDIENGLPADPNRIAVGWSLGGMLLVAAAARKRPPHRALVLVAVNARFIADTTWPQAVDPNEFATLVAGLRTDRAATLRRFSAMCARGQAARQSLRQLIDCLERQPPPSTDVLLDGLSRLQTLDVRDDLSSLELPVLLIVGDADPLVPVAAIEAMRRLNPGIAVHLIAGAGHAPFLSHRAEFLRALDGIRS